MNATALPVHTCVACRELPIPPFDPADREPGADYRPDRPRKIVSGETKRSFRCATHTRAKKAAASLTERTGKKAKRFGIPRELQAALWAFQGSACPCGRKAAPQVPAGVTLDHDHGAPCIVRGEHPEDAGCVECVTGFVCRHCNVEIIGRLEGSFRKALDPRANVREALRSLADHLADPPLPRLLAHLADLSADPKEPAA